MGGSTPSVDVEMSASSPSPSFGFRAASSVLSSDPDLQVYQRFDRLAARNILYLQAEMQELEARLDDLDRSDAAAIQGPDPLDALRAACTWEPLAMERRDNHHNTRWREKKRLVMKLRSVTAEYQDAILRQSRMLDLKSPRTSTHHALKQWCEKVVPLIGYGKEAYSSQRHLVALHTPEDQDRLTKLISRHCGSLLGTRRRPHEHQHGDDIPEELIFYSEKTIHRIVSFISVFLTAVLLVGAIVSLYFIDDNATKLGVIAAFTTLFAASIGLLTNAKRAEVYAATAAYAAVLVVFVGGSLGNSAST